MKANVQEAKIHFSDYLKQVESGEVLIVCRHNKPVAELRPIAHPAAPKQRVAGLLKGQVQWTPDAFAPMSAEEAQDFETSVLFPAAAK